MLDKNIPLGLTQIYDPSTGTTTISWCYLEDSDIEYFLLEYWDTAKRKWVPYDGKNGIIKRDR